MGYFVHIKTTYKMVTARNLYLLQRFQCSNLVCISSKYTIDALDTNNVVHKYDLRLKLASFSKNNPHQRVTLLHTNYITAFIS